MARALIRLELEVESLDLEANGVARNEGKVVFVRGALPGERVAVALVRRKPKFDVAQTVEVLRASSARVQPRCPHFGVCGGCSMQHVDAGTQMAIKQRALEDQLWHLGKVRPQTWLAPVSGPAWRYRHRARLSVRDVPKKGGVLVGFHERASSYVADMRECHVLPECVSDLLLPLRELVESLSIRRRAPQIEVAVGERPEPAGERGGGGGLDRVESTRVRDDACIALVLRVLDAPDDDDLERLRRFAAEHRIEWWLQPKGPDSIELFCDAEGRLARDGASSPLGYALPEFGVRMPFRPTDFTQVNARINEVLVRRALRWLDPQPGMRVVDLFCGLGNFTLPIAARGAQVVGIEGNRTLVERAAANAAFNGLGARCEFRVANLFEVDAEGWRALGRFDAALIDPPREGAIEVVKAIAEDAAKPRRIVYVSCNPATLARDAAVLVHQGGYVLRAVGAVNMFPQTSHVESLAVFERIALVSV